LDHVYIGMLEIAEHYQRIILQIENQIEAQGGW
jgi:hypothetical protein